MTSFSAELSSPEFDPETSSQQDIQEDRPTLIKGEYLPSRKFLSKAKLEELGIDEETRQVLMDAEYYHYLTIQNRFNTIVSCLNSLFGILICALCYISMDYEAINRTFGTSFKPGAFIEQFAFACNTDRPDFWDMEDYSNPGFPRMRAETNFTCQVIYVYIYSTF